MARFRFLDKKNKGSLPKTSGVYLFKSAKECLYIGKATNIRERVKSHFQQPGFRDNLFISKVKKIGYLKTESEIEALLREAELIKKYQPKFNILWKDDKNYFYAAKTKEDFPRIFLTHQPKMESNPPENRVGNVRGNRKLEIDYVGPFVDGKALKKTLRILRKVFPYRTCKKIPKRPCLWYQLELCPSPCLLNSKLGPQIPGFGKKIKKESQQNATTLLKILRGKKTQVLKDLKKEMKKLSKAQKYERAAQLRDQTEVLGRIFQHARILKEFEEREIKNWQEIERELRKILDLKMMVKRIEGYDISNIQGQTAAGSMVVFEKGKPDKNEYRKFKIKAVSKPNDVAMLKEVLIRRFNHPEWKFPQLILIDGGRAQLNAAKSAVKQFNPEGEPSAPHGAGNLKIKIIALAKRKNELYLENQKKPILLKDIPQEIANLILRIRDESHRFAIAYHRKLREKKFTN